MRFVGTLVALIILLLVAAAVVVLPVLGVLVIKNLRQEVAAPTLIGALTIFATASGVVFAQQRQRARENEQQQRIQKIPAYEEFTDTLFRALFHQKLGEPAVTNDELTRLFVGFTRRLTMWGSDETVRKWGAFQAKMRQVEAGSPQLLFEWEELLLALRRDVGHSNRKLKKGDLLRMFVTDIDDHLERPEHQRRQAISQLTNPAVDQQPTRPPPS